jgi:hypothetical protein
LNHLEKVDLSKCLYMSHEENVTLHFVQSPIW